MPAQRPRFSAIAYCLSEAAPHWFEQRFRGRKIFRLGRHARIMAQRERLFLEFGEAIEAHNRADDDVADFERLADAARGAGGDDELRLHLPDDLLPNVDIRQLR